MGVGAETAAQRVCTDTRLFACLQPPGGAKNDGKESKNASCLRETDPRVTSTRHSRVPALHICTIPFFIPHGGYLDVLFFFFPLLETIWSCLTESKWLLVLIFLLWLPRVFMRVSQIRRSRSFVRLRQSISFSILFSSTGGGKKRKSKAKQRRLYVCNSVYWR